MAPTLNVFAVVKEVWGLASVMPVLLASRFTVQGGGVTARAGIVPRTARDTKTTAIVTARVFFVLNLDVILRFKLGLRRNWTYKSN